MKIFGGANCFAVGSIFIISCSNSKTADKSACAKNCEALASVKSISPAQNLYVPSAGMRQDVHTISASGIESLKPPQRELISWEPSAGAIFASDGITSSAGLPPAVPGIGDVSVANRFVLSANNLGNVATSIAGWPVKNFTMWDPVPLYSYLDGGQRIAKQVSYNNAYASEADVHSALQASGNAWGAYMNSKDWANNGKPIIVSYGYSYNLNTAPFPVDSTLYGMNSALLIETDMAVSKYTGKMLSKYSGSVGQALINIVFKDTINNKELIITVRLFDWRGFTLGSDTTLMQPYSSRIGAGFLKEGFSQNASGQMVFSSHLGVGTRYCSMEENSAKSQIAPSTEKQHFAYRITREQLAFMIRDANAGLVDNQYSTNPDKYKLQHIDIRMEGNRLTAPNDINNKLEMSYIGENFKVSTIKWTDLGTAVWGDTSVLEETGAGTKKKIGTAYYPGAGSQQYGLAIFNLGNATTTPVGWPVQQVTQWDPLAPYSSMVAGKAIVKQLSYTNQYSGPADRHSSLQASGFGWGGYMNSDDWMNNGQNMTIRYGYTYKPANAPYVFKSSVYGNNSALLIEANIAVSKYTGKTTAPKIGSIGYAPMNLGFRDMHNNKVLTFIGRFFDWRGFSTATGINSIGGGFLKEGVGRVGTGEMCVGSHFGSGTTYVTKMPTSADSQTAPWTDKRYFAYKITRAQFVTMINDSNTWLTAHEPTQSLYSTNPDDYVLISVDVGIEGTRLTPPSDTANKLEMSYIGDNLRASTISSTP